MTAYLGPAGNLVAFACPSDEQITREDSVSLSRTLGGVQKAQYGRRAPRAWQVGIGTATPGELGQLMGLMHGLYGPPPWTYVGPWAQVTNLLSPAASILRDGSWVGAGVAGGPTLLTGSSRPAYSVVSSTGADLRLPAVPVAQGVPVTGSAWAAGDSSFTVGLEWRNAADDVVGFQPAVHASTPSLPLRRRSITELPPSNAAAVMLVIRGASRIAQPSVTWTSDLAPWSVGAGAPSVVARGLSEAVQLAVHDQPFLRRSSASFVLEEVGNA